MTQNCKVTFGNISKDVVIERVFDSKQNAFKWLLHELVHNANLSSCHELYFRVESYSDVPCLNNREDLLPF